MSKPHAASFSAVAISGRSPSGAGPHYASAAESAKSGAAAELPRLAAVGLHKSYRKGQVAIPVLRDVNFAVKRGEFVSIIGA
ncbi:MAG TPA: hypothetical protein VGJ26_22690, partial [Pirellulales bacterium]